MREASARERPARQQTWLVRLVSQVEDHEPYVDTMVLQTAASAHRGRIKPTIQELDRMLERASAEGVLFTEQRLRFDRTTGAFEPTRLYRVNYQHPLARHALGLEE